MNDADREKLRHIVGETARLDDEIADLREEQKELAAAAKLIGIAPKVVKQLAKESRMDDLQRRAQIALEHSLDQCRADLGMLVGTPLGDAAEELAQGIRGGEVDMRVGDGPWLSETMQRDADAVNGAPRRGRGRPKGAKNKPKEAGSKAPPSPMDPFTAGSPPPDIPEAWN